MICHWRRTDYYYAFHPQTSFQQERSPYFLHPFALAASIPTACTGFVGSSTTCWGEIRHLASRFRRYCWWNIHHVPVLNQPSIHQGCHRNCGETLLVAVSPGPSFGSLLFPPFKIFYDDTVFFTSRMNWVSSLNLMLPIPPSLSG
jgi:hypothetical protein